MQFGLHLVRNGLITAEEFVEVVERQISQRPLFGALAIETRRLSIHQVFEILSVQAEAPKPFGRVAVDLLYLTEAELMELLGRQSERCQPLAEIIVELGILDRRTIDRELQTFRRIMSHEPQDTRFHPQQAAQVSDRDMADSQCQDDSRKRPNTNRKRKSAGAKPAATCPNDSGDKKRKKKIKV